MNFIKRFIHLNACFPGSSHDAFVLSNSGLPTRITTLPEGGWLLGDSVEELVNYTRGTIRNERSMTHTGELGWLLKGLLVS